MPHAIELYLDPVSETFVRRIWDDLLWAGLPSLAAYGTHAHRPHVSLSICGRALGPKVARAVSAALGESAVPIELSGVGTFPGGRMLDARAGALLDARRGRAVPLSLGLSQSQYAAWKHRVW